MELVIRKMKKSDILAIDQGFIRQEWEARTEILENYLREQEKGKRQVLVAELDNQVAGYLTIVPKSKQGPFKDLYPEIVDFNVFERFQRRSIGQKLIKRAAYEVSFSTDILTIGVGLHSGYGAAQRLYIKNGYVPDGSGIWYENRQLKRGEHCLNNDDLVLYFSKKLV